MKQFSKLIQYFREYDLYSNMFSNEIKDKNVVDVLMEDCDSNFISKNMAKCKIRKIGNLLKSKLDMRQKQTTEKLIDDYIDNNVISVEELFHSLPFKSELFLQDIKTKVDQIKSNRNFYLFYPVYCNQQKFIQQPLFTFYCELMEDSFQINKIYTNKNILTLLLAQQKKLEVADVRAEYKEQLDQTISAIDAIHGSQNFFDLYRIICGEFKRVTDLKLEELRPNKDWQALEKATVSFEEPDNIINSCFRDELGTMEDYYNKDNIMPDAVRRFLKLSEIESTDIEHMDFNEFHLGSYHAKFPVNKKQWKVIQHRKKSKLLCIEGPPGTGKSALLKEMVADILVQKADAILKVWDKKWTDLGESGKGINCSPLLGENLNSIIISSTNNKAIDNIGLELLKEVPFFSEFAETIKGTEQDYVGILCARLGNGDNIKNFYTYFFEEFCSYLESKEITPEEAEEVRRSYVKIHAELHAINQKITNFLECRSQFDRYPSFQEVKERQKKLQRDSETLKNQKLQYEKQVEEKRSERDKGLSDAYQDLKRVEIEVEILDRELHTLYSDLKEYENANAFKLCLSFLFPKAKAAQKKYGSAEQIRDMIQEKRNTRVKYEIQLSEINEKIDQKRKKISALDSELNIDETNLKRISKEFDETSKQINLLSHYLELIDALVKHEGFNKTDLLVKDAYDLRNTAEIMQLRNRLFLAALHLFEIYIIMNKKPVLKNLRILLTENESNSGDGSYYNWCRALYNGDEPYPKEKAVLVRTLWETFFLCFPVVTTTLHSFRKSVFQFIPNLFDVLLVDESGQIMPYYVLAPLYRVRNVIFVGDTHQIEPIRNVPPHLMEQKYSEILGPELYKQFCIDSFSAQDYAASASDYCEGSGNNKDTIMLNEHWRCEPAVMEFSNEYIYYGKLDVKGKDNDEKLFNKNLVAFDVRGFKDKEHFNQSEIDACRKIVDIFTKEYGENVKKEIGIITPFSRQAAKLKAAIQGVEVGTVHVFQGAEKKYIIFSAVIDDTPHKDGLCKFIGGKGNLLNVAFSRAKEQFIYVGNFEAVKNSSYYLESALETIMKHGKVFSLFDTDQEGMNDDFLENRDIIRILTGEPSIYANNEIGRYLNEKIPQNIIYTPKLHNEILNDMLSLSKSSFYVVSPWIGDNVVNDTMLDTIEKKIKEGIQIRITFGYKADKSSLDDIDELVAKDVAWRKEGSAKAIRALKDLLKEGLQFSPPSHVKLLLVDDKYLFIGSLNWLFNSGKTQQKEISCLVTNPVTIAYVKENY